MKKFEIAKVLIGFINQHVFFSRGDKDHVPRFDWNLSSFMFFHALALNDDEEGLPSFVIVIIPVTSHDHNAEKTAEVLGFLFRGQGFHPVCRPGGGVLHL